MKNILLLLLCLVSMNTMAQKLEYSATFEGIGDNREYFSRKAKSQTILGARGAFEIGTSIDEHKIRGGLSELYEFGSEIDFHQPKLILYYQLDKEKTNFYFGSFPRRNLIDFPLAMLTDTLLYYRPTIEGMYGEVEWAWGKQNGFVDWTIRQTDVKRENFMAGLSGEIFYKNLFFQNYILMYHDAGPGINIEGDHIKDYMGHLFMGGYRLTKETDLEASIKGGLLTSLFRIRSVTDGYIKNQSFYSELLVKYKNYGIKSTLHAGEGHHFKYGDTFYAQESYWRTDLNWFFIQHKNVQGKFNLSFHLVNGNDLDQSQQLSIIYRFDN